MDFGKVDPNFLLKGMERGNVYFDRYSLDEKTGKIKSKHKLYSKKIDIYDSHLFYILDGDNYIHRWGVEICVDFDYKWIEKEYFTDKKGYVNINNIVSVNESELIGKLQKSDFFTVAKVQKSKCKEIKNISLKYKNPSDHNQLIKVKLASDWMNEESIAEEILKSIF